MSSQEWYSVPTLFQDLNIYLKKLSKNNTQKYVQYLTFFCTAYVEELGLSASFAMIFCNYGDAYCSGSDFLEDFIQV